VRSAAEADKVPSEQKRAICSPKLRSLPYQYGGGQSAFGAKAGDVFTKITVVTVSIWIVGCIILLLAMKQGGNAGGKRGFDELKTSTESGAPVTIPTPAPSPQE